MTFVDYCMFVIVEGILEVVDVIKGCQCIGSPADRSSHHIGDVIDEIITLFDIGRTIFCAL